MVLLTLDADHIVCRLQVGEDSLAHLRVSVLLACLRLLDKGCTGLEHGLKLCD